MTFSVDSTLTGIHSRSERTVRVTRDYDRGRTTKDALDSTFVSDSADLVNLQIKSGLTRISDGQLLWQDFIRPFSESISGLKSGADLSRWYDNNSFYRKPSVVKKLIPPNDASFLLNYSVKSALELVPKKDKKSKSKLSVPGPYTLANLVVNEYYESKSELVGEFARILKKIIRGLPDLGFDAVQINEPSLVYRYGESALTSKKELSLFLSAFEENFSKPAIEVCLHTYFGDSSKILKDLLRLEGITALGIDFTQTSLDSIEKLRFGEKTLACGCVDGRNSLIESPEWIANFCNEAIRTLKPNGIVVLPSSELKYLPRPHADEKIKAIGRACEILTKKVK
jgi:5-methyltetrahydropteroyltriglutamate--homocysteine methyltransferase